MLVQVKERRQRFDEDPVEHEANKRPVDWLIWYGGFLK